MCEENNNEKKVPDFLEFMNGLRKKHVETPSEKILKLALERDKVYDHCKSLSAEIKEAIEQKDQISLF